jgi:hypothetical protein
MSANRRSALKKLLTMPWLAALGSSSAAPPAYAYAGETSVSEHEHRRLGLQVLRFVNTAQLWHRSLTKQYLQASGLKGSEAVARMRTAAGLREPGLDDQFIKHLSFDGKEIVPGWSLQLVVGRKPGRYLAMLNATNDASLRGLASDEKGVIRVTDGWYVVDHSAELPQATELPGSKALVDAKLAPHQQQQPKLIKAAMYVGSLSGAAAFDWCWTCFSCCSCQDVCCYSCSCHCQTDWVEGLNCSNCGCSSCTWACCP